MQSARWGTATLFTVALGAITLPAAFPERKTVSFGEITIEASPGDEAYVEALARRLARPLEPAPTPPPVAADSSLTLARLMERRDYFLARASAWLGLQHPTEKMAFAYDSMPRLWQEIKALPDPGRPRHFALWHREELRARMAAGEKIAGFKPDGQGGLEFGFEFHFDLQAQDSAAERVAKSQAIWRDVVWPVRITGELGETPESAAERALQDFGRYAEMIGTLRTLQLQRSQVFNVLHETVESGVVWTYLASPDRRWFCDGVANYVAWKIIADEIGPEPARAYYDLAAELEKFAAEAPQVNLAAWPVAENSAAASYREQLNTANYAFATQVIADLCAKHGDNLLPRLFAEIGKTSREKATMETVRKAFRKLTREDLDAYLTRAARKPAN